MKKVKMSRGQDALESKNTLIALLKDINNIKSVDNYLPLLIQNLFKYNLAELNMAEAIFEIAPKSFAYLGCVNGNNFLLNEKLLKLKYKNVVLIMDCLLHEFSHIKTAKENEKIQKDEFGHPNKEFLPNINETLVFELLKRHCGLDVETCSDLSVAIYATNQNELAANKTAFEETVALLSSAKTNENGKVVEKMIHFAQINYEKTKAQLLTSSNEMKWLNYKSYVKSKLVEFMLEFASHPNFNPHNVAMFKTARVLFPCPEADQKLFTHFLNEENVDICIKIMNWPDFKNTPKNLQNLIALMQKRNLDLSLLTGILTPAIKRLNTTNESPSSPAAEEEENIETNYNLK